MISVCEKCGSKHIIHIDNMEICDDCLSTIIYDDGGAVLSKHKTTDAFVQYYNSVRNSIGTDNSLSEEVCKKLVSMAMDIPTILNMYGICLVNKGDYDHSIKYFKKAIEINPSYGSAYCNVAKAYYSNGDYYGMLQNLERARKFIFPEDGRYGDFLGEYACALAVNGKIKHAEKALETAEINGFRDGDKVRNVIYQNEKANASTDSISKDSIVSPGMVSTTNEIKEDTSEEKKPRIENADISLPKDSIKDKAGENWKKWLLIAIGVVIVLFIFSRKFRNMVIDLVVGVIFIGLIILAIVEFIRDPVGFLTIALSSAVASSSGGFDGGGRIKIRKGKYSSGEILYTFDGKNIKRGQYSSGEVLYTFDGKNIKQGKYSNGEILYTFDGKYIRKGKYSNGDILYNYDGKYIKSGKYSGGDILYNIDRS